MRGTTRGVLLLLPFVLLPAGLRSGTAITATCNDGNQNQQVSDPQSAACSLIGQRGIASGSGTAAAGSLYAWSYAYSLFPDPFATTLASWDVVFPTAEVLTWQIVWSSEADYAMTLDMGGQYAPLVQWVSEGLTDAIWNQTVPAGEYTFTAYTQDCGEGSASLWANLIATTPVGDPAPEPGTWIQAGGALAGCGLLAAARAARRTRQQT